MRKLVLVLGLLLPGSPIEAEEKRVFTIVPQVGLLQPAWSSGTKKPHLTWFSLQISPFKVGKFVFPTLGGDFQMRWRKSYCVEYGFGHSDYGDWSPCHEPDPHLLLAAGVGYMPWKWKMAGVTVAAVYDMTQDSNPRIGRWGVKIGFTIVPDGVRPF